jgi:hypothetical protein
MHQDADQVPDPAADAAPTGPFQLMPSSKSPLHTPGAHWQSSLATATYAPTHLRHTYASVSNHPSKGSAQPAKLRDPLPLLLFLGSLGAFLAVTVIYAPAFVGAGQLSFEVDSAASSFMYIGLLQAALAGSLSLLCLSLMLSFASSLIWGCLIGSVVFAFVASLASFLAGFVLGGVMWLVFGLISVCYA